MTLRQCRACANQSVSTVLDLGLMPPSRRFLTPELARQSEPIQPLRLLRCQLCGLLQLDSPSPEAVTTQSLSPGLNGLSATDDPRAFLSDLNDGFATDGVVNLYVPDLHALHHRLSFDAICHETRCYFSVGYIANLVREYGLELVDVEPLVDGSGRLRLTVRQRASSMTIRPSVIEAIQRERIAELDRPRAWADFAQLVEMSRDLLMSEIDELLNRGKRVVGWTCGGRGMTLLAFCGIDSLRLSFLVDESPELHGRLTPGHRIPIISPERFEQERPDVVLLIGQEWDPIRECALTDYWQRGGRVLVPLPKPHHVDAYLPAGNRLNGSRQRDTIVPGLSFSEFA
jgi:hypothetical protein